MLITPNTIAFRASISEAELRERMIDEVLSQIGGLDANGRRVPELKVTVLRGTGRVGGYTIEVSGPAPARILLPGGAIRAAIDRTEGA